MNTSEAHAVHSPAEVTAFKRMAGGVMGEAIASIAVVALAIVGLAGVYSEILAAVAAIVFGAAILIEGGFFASTQTEFASQPAEAGASFSSEFLGGITAVVLGILALLGVYPAPLIAIALLVLGASYLLSGGTTDFGGHLLGGLAATVLGILAVVGLDRLPLTLVGLLVLGGMALFSGAAWGARQTARRG
jgi:hypothetical protein